MPICPGGASRVRSGVAATVDIAGSAAGLLSAVPQLKALAPLSYVLTGVSLVTSQLCGSDPPAMPTFTQAEVNALLANDFFSANYASGLQKLKDALSNLAWYQLCECVTGGAQTLPTPPTQPTPPPPLAPNVPNTSQLCLTNAPAARTWAAFGNGYVNAAWTSIATVTNPVSEHVKIISALTGGGSPDTSTVSVSRFASGLATSKFIETAQLALADTFERTYQYDPLFPFVRFSLTPNTNTTPTGQTIQLFGEVFCQSGFPTGALNCCPPDPFLVGKLDAIQAMVTLLQRQLAPFAYIAGTVHAGLSGHGTIAINGLLGASVSVSSYGSAVGIRGTTPSEFFDAGYVTFGTPDGYPTSYRVEHNPMLLLPARCSAYTQLAYDLTPGVTITITELQREP